MIRASVALALAGASLAVFSFTLPAGAQSAHGGEVRAFTGARILPISGPEIPEGTLVVEGGKITAVGPVAEVEIPAGAAVTDLSGSVLLPGLVDTHSHIGGGQGGDRSAPIQPGVRVMDAVNHRHPSFRRARAGGVTTANVMPGSGHLISGQTIYLKLRRGPTLEDLAIRTADGDLAGGLKMANGTNSRKQPPFPGTRGKAAALVRAALIEAGEYREKLRRWEERSAAGQDDDAEGEGEEGGKPKPARDLGLEALGEALDGSRVVHHHTHRHDDVLTVLRLQREFGFRVVLHHVSDAWKVAEEIAAAEVPVSLIIVDSPGGKEEARHVAFESGAVLEKAGVEIAFHTDDLITDSRLFLRSAGLAVRSGMSREKALEALTLAPARMIDLGDRIGSLEPGKDADFVVLSGDPLSVYTQVLETWIEGEKVFDRSDPEDLLAATGGYGAGEPHGHLHGCLDEEVGR